MYYVGLDVHKSQVTMCVLDKSGEVAMRRVIHGGTSAVVRALGGVKGRVAVCFEASQGAGHFRDALRGAAERVVVANPMQLRLIAKSKRKNDKADAEKLAKLLILNLVPEAHVPEIEVRAWRQMIEYRRKLLGRRTGVKSAIRSHLRAYGKSAGRGLWTRAGLKWLASESFPDALAVARRDLLLDELRDAEERLGRATAALDEKARTHPGVALLMTIPGVGPRTAEAVMAYINDPRRFRRTNQVGTYFGLIPEQDQSASVNRLGHITRQGPSVVRWLLTEAAWQGIRKSPTLRRHYERVLRGDKKRRKIAAVATAHFLARAMLAMLRTGEEWREVA